MADIAPSRGWQGTILRLMRAGDYLLTVTGRQMIGPRYLRLSFSASGLLADQPPHPTMWIRLWFADGGRLHQRGYTLVNPRPVADAFDIEFALHDGLASRWAEAAQPGDTIHATVLGSYFRMPRPAPSGFIIVGDTASLPAINSLLGAIGDVPAQVFLEANHDSDRELPVAGDGNVVWVDRLDNGEALLRAVSEASFEAPDHFGWVACDNRTTRAVAKVFREKYLIPRRSIKAQGYWQA